MSILENHHPRFRHNKRFAQVAPWSYYYEGREEMFGRGGLPREIYGSKLRNEGVKGNPGGRPPVSIEGACQGKGKEEGGRGEVQFDPLLIPHG